MLLVTLLAVALTWLVLRRVQRRTAPGDGVGGIKGLSV